METNLNSDDLESLVDRWGLAGVLESLSEICGEKAEHLRSAWQDGNAAKDWERAGKVLDRASVARAVVLASPAVRIYNHGR